MWRRLGSEWDTGINSAFPPSGKLCWSHRDVTPPEQQDSVSSLALSSHAPNPARYLWALNTCYTTTLFSSASLRLFLILGDLNRGWEKGRRRCKTLIFMTNDYLQNRVLLQPHLTSKHIQHTVMLRSWLTTELEVKLNLKYQQLFLISTNPFQKEVSPFLVYVQK